MTIKYAVLAFALLGATAHARTLPVVADSYGSTVTQLVSKASGRATTLPVSAKSEAYFYFDVAHANLPADNITAARLFIYCPKVTRTGELSVNVLGEPFAETFTPKTVPVSASVASVATFNVFAEDPKRFFVIPVTDIVRQWAAGAAAEFGFSIRSGGTAIVTIAAKEGAATGHPAMLEVDVNTAEGPATFSSISSGTGAFSGAMTGATASFSGAVTGSAGNFSTVNGGSGNFTGNVGIGVNATTYPLSVQQNQSGEVLAFKKAAGANAWHLSIDNGALNFFETGVAGARLFLEPGGAIGVGTNAPGAKLDVRGDIRFGPNGQWFVPGGSENLRIVRGSVSFDTSIRRGSGFTVSRKNGFPTGFYVIAFDTAFPAPPTIVATPEAGVGGVTVSAASDTVVSAEVRIYLGAALENANFHFIAVGPR